MDKKLRILFLEDNPSDVKLLLRQLKKSNLSYDCDVVDNKKDFIHRLYNSTPDIILSDHSLPTFNSLEALRIIKDNGFDIPFILVTGTVPEEFAVKCMKEGADDYLLKSSLVRLPAAIENCLAKSEMVREKKVIEALHEKLKAAYNEMEQMHHDITESIHYAKHIQEALLPPLALLETLIPQSFIIYKPKDIISGDFYWFDKIDDKIVIAVADCTGHGVPGALMSMIGNNILTEIVSIKRVTVPGDILRKLNKGVRKLLKQDKTGAKGQDGMDISVCTIDLTNLILQYAGANQHLFYFRGKKFELVKSDKKCIGGFQAEKERTYTNHEISYQPGDTIYMSTDGYADQFGGRKEKRMQTKNLIKLIQSTITLGLNEQEKLLAEWLEKWKGELKQTDDILLVGIGL